MKQLLTRSVLVLNWSRPQDRLYQKQVLILTRKLVNEILWVKLSVRGVQTVSRSIRGTNLVRSNVGLLLAEKLLKKAHRRRGSCCNKETFQPFMQIQQQKRDELAAGKSDEFFRLLLVLPMDRCTRFGPNVLTLKFSVYRLQIVGYKLLVQFWVRSSESEILSLGISRDRISQKPLFKQRGVFNQIPLLNKGLPTLSYLVHSIGFLWFKHS